MPRRMVRVASYSAVLRIAWPSTDVSRPSGRECDRSSFVPEGAVTGIDARRPPRGDVAGDQGNRERVRRPPARRSSHRWARRRRAGAGSTASRQGASARPRTSPAIARPAAWRTTIATTSPARGAKREADADFARALRDRVHQHTVDADRRQQHRDEREQARAAAGRGAVARRRRPRSAPCVRTRNIGRSGSRSASTRAQRFDERRRLAP